MIAQVIKNNGGIRQEADNNAPDNSINEGCRIHAKNALEATVSEKQPVCWDAALPKEKE